MGLITLLITTLDLKPYIPIDPFKGTLRITLLITTHEAPSSSRRRLCVGCIALGLGPPGFAASWQCKGCHKGSCQSSRIRISTKGPFMRSYKGFIFRTYKGSIYHMLIRT